VLQATIPMKVQQHVCSAQQESIQMFRKLLPAINAQKEALRKGRTNIMLTNFEIDLQLSHFALKIVLEMQRFRFFWMQIL
jgi:hypothetical protein